MDVHCYIEIIMKEKKRKLVLLLLLLDGVSKKNSKKEGRNEHFFIPLYVYYVPIYRLIYI